MHPTPDSPATLLDPTLRKPRSSRFAVGRLIEGAENTFGFIVPKDVKQKIYQAERFFAPNFDHYRNHLSDNADSVAWLISHLGRQLHTSTP